MLWPNLVFMQVGTLEVDECHGILVSVGMADLDAQSPGLKCSCLDLIQPPRQNISCSRCLLPPLHSLHTASKSFMSIFPGSLVYVSWMITFGLSHVHASKSEDSIQNRCGANAREPTFWWNAAQAAWRRRFCQRTSNGCSLCRSSRECAWWLCQAVIAWPSC